MPGKKSAKSPGSAEIVKDKKCFIICPIGANGSDDRLRSDKLLKYIIEPICNDFGFECIRADRVANPGIITNQIIEYLVDSELVIADLTGRNPNVFYELGIRHCAGKPYIQLIHGKPDVPFDIANVRTTSYSLEVDAIKPAQEALTSQIKWILDNPDKIINPVSLAVNMATLSHGNSAEQTFGLMSKVLLAVNKKVDNIDEQVRAMVGGFCTVSLDDIKSSIDDVEYKVLDLESKLCDIDSAVDKISSSIDS